MPLETFPSAEKMQELAKHARPFMHQSTKNPHAVWFEGLLSKEECNNIISYMGHEEPYKFNSCGAVTREAPRPLSPVFQSMESFARFVNSCYWGFDLDGGPSAWMQTYENGGDYSKHTDGCPGYVRKLTAVVQLSEDLYEGGDLVFEDPQEQVKLVRTRGTVAVFPPWVWHHVTPVTSGIRRTINMGFWGPPFK